MIRAEHSFREGLPCMVCVCVCVCDREWGDRGPSKSKTKQSSSWLLQGIIIIQYAVWRQVQSLFQNDSST